MFKFLKRLFGGKAGNDSGGSDSKHSVMDDIDTSEENVPDVLTQKINTEENAEKEKDGSAPEDEKFKRPNFTKEETLALGNAALSFIVVNGRPDAKAEPVVIGELDGFKLADVQQMYRNLQKDQERLAYVLKRACAFNLLKQRYAAGFIAKAIRSRTDGGNDPALIEAWKKVVKNIIGLEFIGMDGLELLDDAIKEYDNCEHGQVNPDDAFAIFTWLSRVQYSGHGESKDSLKEVGHGQEESANNEKAAAAGQNRKTSRVLFRFSVGPKRQVLFSPGNLQYQASTNTWRFAENQWNMIGEGNDAVSPTNSGWIDLFGWGTGNAPTKASTNDDDYDSFNDWGNNSILNGMNKKWRSMTMDEWLFVIKERRTDSGIRFAKANVNGINGLILLPDNWEESFFHFSQVNESDSRFDENIISANEWTNIIEVNGAVFLPAAGERLGKTVNLSSWSSYWSSSAYEGNGKDCANSGFSIKASSLGCRSRAQRSEGKSVRLVCDIDSNEEKASLVSKIEVHIIQNNGQGKGSPTENPKDKDFSIGNAIFKMVFVEGGTFMMGGEARNGTEDKVNLPQHEVSLSDYYISETPVTQQLWKIVLGENPCEYKDRGDDKPVIGVSYDETVNRFLSKLNELMANEGVAFALPSEAEWEFAARGGKKSQGFKYAGSDCLDDVAWMGDNSNDVVHNVKEKLPNELGLYDMSGNVWEWCQDFYGAYEDAAQANPSGPTTGMNRVVRGGDFSQNEKACRVNMRWFMAKDFYWNTGIRLVIRTKPMAKPKEKSESVKEKERKLAKDIALSLLKLFCASPHDGIQIQTVVDDYFVIVKNAATARMPSAFMQAAKSLPSGVAWLMVNEMVKQEEWHDVLNAISLLEYGLRIVVILGQESAKVELTSKQLADELEKANYKPNYDTFYN